MKRQGISCNGKNSNDLTIVDMESVDRAPPPSATPMDLIRNPNIRKKFFILAFDWVANAVVYNGLSYNTTNLGVSDYLAFFIGNVQTIIIIHCHSLLNATLTCILMNIPLRGHRGDTILLHNLVRDGPIG